MLRVEGDFGRENGKTKVLKVGKCKRRCGNLELSGLVKVLGTWGQREKLSDKAGKKGENSSTNHCNEFRFHAQQENDLITFVLSYSIQQRRQDRLIQIDRIRTLPELEALRKTSERKETQLRELMHRTW